MGGVVRRYIDILIIIITFPYSTCISSFFGSSIPILLCSFLKCFFGLVQFKGASSFRESSPCSVIVIL